MGEIHKDSDKAGVEFPKVMRSEKECTAWPVEGQKIHMFGVDLPQKRCSYAEMLIKELMPAESKHHQDTSEHFCAAMKSEEVHKDIIRGELFTFKKLEARCSEHSKPCRRCAAKATLYETGGRKNLKTIELIKKKMRKRQIHKNLYQIK